MHLRIDMPRRAAERSGKSPPRSAIALSKQHPICSRPRRSERPPRRQQSRSRQRRSIGTSCPKDLPNAVEHLDDEELHQLLGGGAR
jgi:hypothetical protein